MPSGYDGNALSNEFWRVHEAQLREAENRMGINIPSDLREFYTTVGHGHLVRSRHGVLQSDYFNSIVDVEYLTRLWCRDDVCFQYDSEIFDERELPFFDMGSYSYLVLRPRSENPNAVYFPYDKKPVCFSFCEFVSRLYQDTTFYLKHEGVYEL
ncbi:SMI1/KNR4 family protein [Halomonas sp. DP4Y7-2]|uniref:SMI1/KNR4 family protein n=1 Tax=unclassified Halomonas TaxID=2609666 RepID=UPI0039656F0E